MPRLTPEVERVLRKAAKAKGISFREFMEKRYNRVKAPKLNKSQLPTAPVGAPPVARKVFAKRASRA